MDRWDMANKALTLHVRKELPTNWKAAQEALLEAHHILATHAHSYGQVPGLEPSFDQDRNNLRR